jgi:hypothetical protein
MDPKKPAFPQDPATQVNKGLEIRDYVAIEMAKALIMARVAWDSADTAKQAFWYADALISESNKKQS